MTEDEAMARTLGLDGATPAPVAPRRAPRTRATEQRVHAAHRRVLAALDGLAPGEQLRVLRAAALLLGPDEPTG